MRISDCSSDLCSSDVQDSQFHWTSRGYGSFDDFLLNLSSRKRKDIRKERAAAVAGLEIVHLTGGEISEAHLDIFWHFYQDTGARKWGRPYLTRACFSLLVARVQPGCADRGGDDKGERGAERSDAARAAAQDAAVAGDRKSVVQGKRVPVRVDLGSRRGTN